MIHLPDKSRFILNKTTVNLIRKELLLRLILNKKLVFLGHTDTINSEVKEKTEYLTGKFAACLCLIELYDSLYNISDEEVDDKFFIVLLMTQYKHVSKIIDLSELDHSQKSVKFVNDIVNSIIMEGEEAIENSFNEKETYLSALDKISFKQLQLMLRNFLDREEYEKAAMIRDEILLRKSDEMPTPQEITDILEKWCTKINTEDFYLGWLDFIGNKLFRIRMMRSKTDFDFDSDFFVSSIFSKLYDFLEEYEALDKEGMLFWWLCENYVMDKFNILEKEQFDKLNELADWKKHVEEEIKYTNDMGKNWSTIYESFTNKGMAVEVILLELKTKLSY